MSSAGTTAESWICFCRVLQLGYTSSGVLYVLIANTKILHWLHYNYADMYPKYTLQGCCSKSSKALYSGLNGNNKVMLEWVRRLLTLRLFLQLKSPSFWRKRIFKFLWEFRPHPHVHRYFLCSSGLLSTCKLILWSLKFELLENSFQGEDFWKTLLYCLLVMWTWSRSCIILSLKKKATWVVWWLVIMVIKVQLCSCRGRVYELSSETWTVWSCFGKSPWPSCTSFCFLPPSPSILYLPIPFLIRSACLQDGVISLSGQGD